MTKRSLAAACAAAFAVTGVLTVGVPAASAAETETVTGTVTRYERGVLRPLAAGATGLGRKAAAARSNFLQTSAKRGANLDARAVNVFTDPGDEVLLTTGAAEVVDGIDVGTVDGVVAGMGVRTHESPTKARTAAAPVLGFAGTNPTTSGYVLDATGHHQVSKADDGDISSNYLNSWYWKYNMEESKEIYFGAAAQRDSDFWVYARRGEADAKASGHSLVDLTVRARPWGGTSGNIRDLIADAPAGTTAACSDRGAFGFGYGQASVTIPRVSCVAVSGVTNKGQYEFGTDWDGDTANQVAIEAIASYRVKAGVKPVFADYIWATFDPGVFSSNKDVKWTDTGW